MGRYTVPGNVAALSTVMQSAGVVYATSGAARRGFVVGLDVGAAGAPNATDCQIQWELIRQTAAGTATAFTPNPSDPADAACSATAGIAATVEGTTTASSQVWQKALNQRSTWGWEGDRVSALVWPATPNAGFALRGLNTVASSYAGKVLGTIRFEE